jgi:hypothetical protein
MYGSMWIAIPQEAHAALFEILRKRQPEPEPSSARTRVELRQRPDPPVDLHLIEQDTKLALDRQALEAGLPRPKAGQHSVKPQSRVGATPCPLTDDEIPF